MEDSVELMADGGIEGGEQQLPVFGGQVEVMDQRAEHEGVVFVVTGGRQHIKVV